MNALAAQNRQAPEVNLNFTMAGTGSLPDVPAQPFEYDEDPVLPLNEDRVIAAEDLIMNPDAIVVEHIADILPNQLPDPITTVTPEAEPTVPAVFSSEPNPELEHEIEPDNDTPLDPDPTIALPDDTSFIEPEVLPTESRYLTRSQSRGGTRLQWDRRTNQPIPMDSETRERAYLAAKVRSKASFNIQRVFHMSVKKAMAQMPKQAIASMYKEIKQMSDKDVWSGVEPTFKHKKKVIKSFMFLKEKFLPNGDFDKLKARLVAGGHMQDRDSLASEDTSSPTATLSFLFMIASIAARDGRHVRTFDIGGAYLNADISKREILMELDQTASAILLQIDPYYKKFMRSNGTIVVKLRKALYGCVESAKLWHDLLSATLKSKGYIQNPLDPCVFNKTVGKDQCTVIVYVDDLMVTCRDIILIEELEAALKTEFKEITSHEGLIHSYLGMEFDFSVSGQVKVRMEGYISDLLSFSEIQGTAKTPAANHLFDVRDSPKLNELKKDLFHTLTAKLLYLAKRTRPDTLLPVSFLTTRVQAPDEDDWLKLERVLKYLNGTPDFGICLKADSPTKILAHIDASYGVHIDGKSHSGMFVSLGSGPIMVKSSKQKIVTKSSTEAELIALSDQSGLVIWSRDFLVAQGETPGPAVIGQDNQSAMALADRGASVSERTRHIHIRHYWIKDRVDFGDIQIVFTPTADMIADIFTKPLQGDRFYKIRAILLNWSC
jgi:hypothetical protein